MKLSYHLDWLSFSDPCLYGMDYLMSPVWAMPQGDVLTPLRGYNRALKLKVGRVDWHDSRISQKRLWTLTASDLVELEKLDFSERELMRDVNRTLGVNVTRLDFAVDIRDANASPDDVELAWREKRVKTQARNMTPVEAISRKGQGQGKTVYIGSRASAAFLRVYDKGREQGTNEDWTRIEIETKSPLAGRLAAEMDRLGVASAGTSCVRKFVEMEGVGWWSDALSGAGEADLSGTRKVTDWEKWVRGVALPNVIQAIYREVPGVKEALEAALQEHHKTCTVLVQK